MVLPVRLPGAGEHDEVAAATIKCLRHNVPAAMPAIVFLSGGESDEASTAHLNAINRLGPQPWELSFSFGRVLQGPALRAGGVRAPMSCGAAAYLRRVKLNGAARTGIYSPAQEPSHLDYSTAAAPV